MLPLNWINWPASSNSSFCTNFFLPSIKQTRSWKFHFWKLLCLLTSKYSITRMKIFVSTSNYVRKHRTGCTFNICQWCLLAVSQTLNMYSTSSIPPGHNGRPMSMISPLLEKVPLNGKSLWWSCYSKILILGIISIFQIQLKAHFGVL